MKITIITVCLNSVKTIERAVKSVVGQNYHDLEYIVVDGGSTDGTTGVLHKYGAYIDKLLSEPDRGIFDAMNKGIRLATGDVIAFLNSDDWYEQDVFSEVERAFLDGNCDCICFDNFVLDKEGNVVYYDASDRNFDDLYIQMIYYHSAIFCKKEFFNKERNFNLKYKLAADYDWLLKTLKQGLKIQYVHKPVFTFCYGGISSVNQIACAWEAKHIALCHLPADRQEYTRKISERFQKVIIDEIDSVTLYQAVSDIFAKGSENILWGAGNIGREYLCWFHKLGIEIGAVVDRNEKLWGKDLQGVGIYPPHILEKISCNLFIATDRYVTEIENEVGQIGNENICVFTPAILNELIIDYITIRGIVDESHCNVSSSVS